MYLALARKYRPKRFADVAVQSHVSNTLKGAIARGRVAHGYLLCGPRGVGKTTLARVLAMALNCERRGEHAAGLRAEGTPPPDETALASAEGAGEPCGECASCTRIWSGSASLDVIEIDAASNRGVDDARDLRERAMYAPTAEDRYKVYIVDEAHMLTREAWNALLKILEEPPPRVIFVFATTDPQRIAQAAAPVMSRLQRFDFKRISPAEVRQRLTTVLAAEAVGADDEALAMIARAADGSMRDALSLTDQVLSMGEGRLTASAVRGALGLVPEEEYLGLLELIADRRAADVFPAVGRLAESGVDFAVFLAGLADLLRAQLAVVLGGEAPDVSEQTRAALRARRDRFSAPDLLRMLGAIAEIEPYYRKSSQQQLLLETLLVRFALLDRTVELEDLLRGIGDGGGARETASPPSKRAPDAPRPTMRRAEPPPMAPPLADVPAPAAKPAPRVALDLNVLCERWGEVVDRVRSAGRPMLVSALEHALPVAVSAQGTITVQLEQPNEIFERAIETGAAEVLSAVAGTFEGATKLMVRRVEQPAPAVTDAPKRLTEDQARRERAQLLRKKDPALDAAIEELDLELLE